METPGIRSGGSGGKGCSPGCQEGSPRFGLRSWPQTFRLRPLPSTAVDGHAEHAVGSAHRLASAPGRPVGLEDAVAVARVAALHPEVAPGDEPVDGRLGHRVPRHLPAHELPVPVALLERTPAEDGEGDTARVQVAGPRRHGRRSGVRRTRVPPRCRSDVGTDEPLPGSSSVTSPCGSALPPLRVG
jgi:hypothetical protein